MKKMNESELRKIEGGGKAFVVITSAGVSINIGAPINKFLGSLGE